jgi:hypothetical protein
MLPREIRDALDELGSVPESQRVGREASETEFSRKLLRPHIVMELGSHDAIIGAVEQDVGISILPLSLVRRDVERRAVCALPVRPARLRHAVCVVYYAERAAFPLTRRLIEISRELQRSGAFHAAGTNSPSVSRRSTGQPRRQPAVIEGLCHRRPQRGRSRISRIRDGANLILP